LNIAVVGGTGYVGLTTAVGFASRGHFVYCIGRNLEKVRKICRGIPTIYEEGLKDMLNDALTKKRLLATTNLNCAIQDSDVSFVCVGTPNDANGKIDLTQIKSATRRIGLALKGKKSYHVIVIRSTVIPGTTENILIPLLEKFSKKKASLNFGVCMNPEFLREGCAINDFLYPCNTGIVIGELDKKSGDIVSEIYRDFHAEIFRTNLRAAEMIKYARNCYLAKDISFANEIANICQKLGVDYLEVKKGMELDSRIGKGRFLNAGVGFGGSCLPKDVLALATKAKELGIKPRMLEATLTINEEQYLEIIALIKKALKDLKGKKIAVLGLAFKPGTDDMREARSQIIINALIKEGAKIYAYDPKAINNAKKIFGNEINYAEKPQDALTNADACVIVTEWPEFSNPKLYKCMRGKVIIDGRRMLNPRDIPSDFKYYAIGFPIS